MFKNNLKALMLHICICILSLIVLFLLNVPVPIIFLKDAVLIGKGDFIRICFFVVFILIVYFAGGLFLKPDKSWKKNFLSTVSILILYLLANFWLISNISSLSFTANDPTPDSAIGGLVGVLFGGLSVSFDIPLLILQMLHWSHLQLSWFNKYYLLLFAALPSLMMWMGIEFKKRKLKKREIQQDVS